MHSAPVRQSSTRGVGSEGIEFVRNLYALYFYTTVFPFSLFIYSIRVAPDHVRLVSGDALASTARGVPVGNALL